VEVEVEEVQIKLPYIEDIYLRLMEDMLDVYYKYAHKNRASSIDDDDDDDDEIMIFSYGVPQFEHDLNCDASPTLLHATHGGNCNDSVSDDEGIDDEDEG
jgi:hypothetical protein